MLNVKKFPEKIKTIQAVFAIFVVLASFVFFLVDYDKKLARKSDLPNLEKFVSKNDLLETKFEVLITILTLKASDYEDKIASGNNLSPIESNRYNKTLSDIKRYQDKLERLAK